MNDFRRQWSEIGGQALAAMGAVGRSGRLILGPEVKAFERDLARFWRLPRAVGCGSGLDALVIALKALGVKRGDRVLTTPLTAFATTLAILNCGATPVFSDVDGSGLIDLESAERALRRARRRIRFFVPVHLYGHAIDVWRLRAFARRFELTTVEDCAQAIGATSAGRPVGSASEIAAVSFYPTKNLGCLGDGGAVLTRSARLAERAASLRDYGQTAKYVHRFVGMNSRLDELHAAVLRRALLPRLGAFIERRRRVARRYRAEIRNPRLAVPPVPEGSRSVWHLFPVLVRGSRGSFQRHLASRGVASAVHYPVLAPDQGAMRAVHAETLGPLDRARFFARREVSLPIHPYLTDREVERVISACNSWT